MRPQTRSGTPPPTPLSAMATPFIPEIFSAAPQESIELFFANFERLAAISGWTEDKQKEIFALCLSGPPKFYYNTNKDTLTTLSWKDLKQNFSDRFGKSKTPLSALLKYRNRQQGKNELLTHYLFEKKHLADLSDSNLRFSDFLTEAISGMRPEYILPFAQQTIKTFKDLIELATVRERAQDICDARVAAPQTTDPSPQANSIEDLSNKLENLQLLLHTQLNAQKPGQVLWSTPQSPSPSPPSQWYQEPQLPQPRSPSPPSQAQPSWHQQRHYQQQQQGQSPLPPAPAPRCTRCEQQEYHNSRYRSPSPQNRRVQFNDSRDQYKRYQQQGRSSSVDSSMSRASNSSRASTSSSMTSAASSQKTGSGNERKKKFRNRNTQNFRSQPHNTNPIYYIPPFPYFQPNYFPQPQQMYCQYPTAHMAAMNVSAHQKNL